MKWWQLDLPRARYTSLTKPVGAPAEKASAMVSRRTLAPNEVVEGKCSEIDLVMVIRKERTEKSWGK